MLLFKKEVINRGTESPKAFVSRIRNEKKSIQASICDVLYRLFVVYESYKRDVGRGLYPLWGGRRAIIRDLKDKTNL